MGTSVVYVGFFQKNKFNLKTTLAFIFACLMKSKINMIYYLRIFNSKDNIQTILIYIVKKAEFYYLNKEQLILENAKLVSQSKEMFNGLLKFKLI